MVTFDRLPMRDVLVERLGWSEENARAFLEVLEAPTERLATQEDIAALRADIDQIRADLETLRGELAELRTDLVQLRSEVGQLRSDLEHLRSELEALRRELVQHREDTRAAFAEMEQRLTHYIDQRISELDRLNEARLATAIAEFQAQIRTYQVRMTLLITGVGGSIIGLLIALLARS